MAHRYWRLLCTSDVNSQVAFTEIQMRAAAGGADQTSSAFAISSGGTVLNAASNAFDDSLTTQWLQNSAGGGPGLGFGTASVGQDFGAATTVAEITAYEQFGSAVFAQAPVAVQIQYSDDGAAWTTTDTYSNLTWADGETKTFSVTDAAGGSSVTVTATAGSLAISGGAGAVVTSANETARGVAGSLGITGQQAHVFSETPVIALATDGSASVIGQAANVNVGENTLYLAAAGTLSLAGADAATVVGEPESIGPVSTDTAGGWRTNTGGMDLQSGIDEVSPDDGDFIYSANDPSGDVGRVKFGAFDNTSFVAPLRLSYRIGKSGPGSVSTTVRLKQGTTVIASWVHADDVLTTYDRVIDPAAISDFTDLYLEFEAA